MPFSVARRRHRINREHLISRCKQSLHPWAAVGLDPDDDISGRLPADPDRPRRSKALRRAVLDVFDTPVLARCQLHKIRNVGDKLPQRLRPGVERRMREAYHADCALAAEAQLNALARELDKTHPSGAASLREGMRETLTVLRLNVPPRHWPARCARLTRSKA